MLAQSARHSSPGPANIARVERWALVTAAARGLGAALAEHLSEAGLSVVLHYHESAGAAAALVARAEARGARVVPVAADLATARGREDLAAETARVSGGRLHLLVNNLGVYPLEHLLETSLAGFERTFALTCTANFHLTQLALPLLRAAGPGASVINLGDSGADRVEAHDDATPYHIAKLGVHVLTRSYAARLAPEGIRVNMISPGFLVNSVGEPEPPLPSGRKGTFADVIAALDYLTSDRAAYVSGANLVVSGAWNV